MFRSQFVAALAAASALPAWLVPGAGRFAYLAEAPWPMGEHPEAAATYSLRTARIEPAEQAQRPRAAVGAPIGALARCVDLAAPAVARLHLPGAAKPVYARLDRLVPAVPPGTRLVVAGGFGNEALFYPRLDAPVERAGRVPTGTPLVALGIDTAPYDPDGLDFVRVRVRIAGGPWHGRTGWIPAAYTGLTGLHRPAESTAERACGCRILEFRPG